MSNIATHRAASMSPRPKRTTPETTEIQLCDQTITVDSDDVARIAKHKWMLDSTANVVKIFRWYGPFDSHRIPQLLESFLLLEDQPLVYVERVKPWAWNFSKSNLRVSKHSMIKPKGWVTA
jgi:hypothetical protein